MMTKKKIKQQIKDQKAIAQDQITRLHHRIHDCREQFNTNRRKSIQTATQLVDLESRLLTHQLESNQQQIASLQQSHPAIFQDSWQHIESDKTSDAWPTPFITIGSFQEHRTQLRFPLFAPFIGQSTTLVIESQDENKGKDVLNALMLRIAFQLTNQFKLSLLDPYSQGRAFPLAKALELYTRPLGHELGKNLDTLQNEISRIIGQYTDSAHDSFEKLPNEFHLSEPYEFIFIAHFPNDFRDCDIQKLQRIARNGPAAGKYLIIQCAPNSTNSPSIDWSEFGNHFSIHTDDHNGSSQGYTKRFSFMPNPAQQVRLLEKLGKQKKTNPQVPFETSVALPPDQWWKESSSKRIQTTIGRHGVNNPLDLYFGESDEGMPCAHGIWAGMTGSGKSNSYHVLICGLAQRYSPQDLQLYLIDGKNGVEFQDYRNLPHAKAVVLHSLPELSRSVLEELVTEKERRNEIFSKSGVTNLRDYKEQGQPQGELPRLLLIVDEYQELFTDDDLNVASTCLREIAQQGRSAGIHMLLGSQSFQVDNMRNKSSILGNCHLRLAMKMPSDKIDEILEFGKKGKSLIHHCDLPGKIVANVESGDDTRNILGQIAYLRDEHRRQIIKQLTVKDSPSEFKPLVIDGCRQPKFTQTPFIKNIIEMGIPNNTKRFEHIATKPQNEGGLGHLDWHKSEANLLLGQHFNVHDYAQIRLRRSNLENILLIGEHQQTHYGMIIGIIQSLVFSHHQRQCRFILVDRNQTGTSWHQALQEVAKCAHQLGLSIQHIGSVDQSVKVIGRLVEQTEQERGHAPLSGPTILCIPEAEHFMQLHTQPDKYDLQKDSPLGEQLKTLYTRGPLKGIHVLMSFGLVTPMQSVLQKKALKYFRHQILMQVSEEDSINILQHRKAAQLQSHGAAPIAAIYCDRIGGKESRFKPYSCESATNFQQETQTLKNLKRKTTP